VWVKNVFIFGLEGRICGMLCKNLPPKLSAGQFKRLTGVKRSTFELMCHTVAAVKEQRRKHPKKGKTAILGIADQLMMMLMYHREYRTYLHIAVDYGISESQCWRIIDDLQNILIQSKLFSLPGKKALVKSDIKWSVVLVDVGESPVERPKKNSGATILAKRKSIPLKHN
jgi:hypothetical protein